MKRVLEPVRVGDVLPSTRSGMFTVIKVGATLAEVRIRFLHTGYEKVVTNSNAIDGKVSDPYARLSSGIGYMGREKGSKKNK